MSSFNTTVAMSGFNLNLNPITVARNNGQGQAIATNEKRGLAIKIGNYSTKIKEDGTPDNRHLGYTPIAFDETATEPATDGEHQGLVAYRELLAPEGGVDIEAAFNAALFDFIKAKWPEFDPAANGTGDIPRYIRLDRVEATLAMHEPETASVQAVIGVYGLPNYSRKHAIAYLRIKFFCGEQLRTREKNLATYTTKLASINSELASTEDGPQKDQLLAMQAECKRVLAEAAEEYVAPLAELLAIADIKAAVGDMSMAVWKELKAKHAAFGSLDLVTKEANYGPYYDALVQLVA